MRYFLTVTIACLCFYCPCLSQNTFHKEMMNKGMEGVADEWAKQGIEWQGLFGNRVYEEVNKQYEKSQRSVGKRAATADRSVQNQRYSSEPRQAHTVTSGGIQIERGSSGSSSTSRRSNGSYNDQIKRRNQEIQAYNDEVRRRRNEEIERHNEQVRAYNEELERRRRIEEEARRRRLYHEGYVSSMMSTSGYYSNLHGKVERSAVTAAEIRNNHQADGIARVSGYVAPSGQSAMTKKRSGDDIFVSRPTDSKPANLDYNSIPITQMSNATSTDFLPAEIRTRSYYAHTITPELTWEWVKQHPEDSWKWVKQKAVSIDEFLDYQRAIDDGKDGFFTSTVRSVYQDAKMAWYNHDMSLKVSETFNRLKGLLDPEEARKRYVDDYTGNLAENLTNDGFKFAKLLKPLVTNRSGAALDDAQAIAGYYIKSTKNLKAYVVGAPDATANNQERQYLSERQPERKIAKETQSLANKVAKNRGLPGLPNSVEKADQIQSAIKKTEKEASMFDSEQEKATRTTKNLLKEEAIKQANKRKNAAIDQFKTAFIDSFFE